MSDREKRHLQMEIFKWIKEWNEDERTTQR